MERWFKYKGNIINLGQIQSFSVERMSMRNGGVEAIYTDDLKPTKEKPYTLMAGHHGIDVFKTKAEALQLAEDIVKGKYDID